MAVPQVLILSNGITSQEIKPGEINRAIVKTGEHYRVLEKTVDKDQLLDDVLAKKEGQDLHLVYSDGTEVILEDYYTVCADGACDVTLPGETASGYQIGTNDVTGIAASEESSLVYAHGHRDTLISMTQDTPMQATLSDLEGAQITYLPEEATGLSMGALGGLALLGGVIAVANSSDAVNTVNNTVTGTIVGGPVLAGNDLKVIAYQADGVSVLGEGTVDATGKFNIDVGSYTGVVIAKVINQGTEADYLDEATGVGKDLNAEIFSTGIITSANSTLTLNLNAVTTIAYIKALESTVGAPLDETTVNSTNTAIAQAFGLSDLNTTVIITTNGTTSFDSSDGLNAGETYGTILAALSGADKNNAGKSQATIDNLVAGITISGETATLTAAVQDKVIQGADIALVNSGGETSVIVDTIAPVITSTATATAIDENSGASQVIYTATAVDSSTITYTLKTGSDAGLTINSTTGDVTLTADPDFETKPSYSFTVVATDTANNASEQAVAITVTNVNDAPVANADTGAVAENSSVTVAVLTNDTDADDGAVLTLDTVSAPANKGTVSIVANELVFVANAADLDHLELGVTEEVIVTYTMSDESGTAQMSTATITVTGTNDTPTISAYTEVTNVAENTLTGSISTLDVGTTDIDTNDTHSFVALTNVATTVTDTNAVDIGAITVSMTTAGAYTLTGAGIEKLGAGESATVTFDVQVIDDSADGATDTSVAQTITLTLDGSNDTPTISAYTEVTNVLENVLTGSISTSDVVTTDADTNDTHSFVALSGASTTVTDTNSVGIGEHPQVMEELRGQIQLLTDARDNIDTIVTLQNKEKAAKKLLKEQIK